MTKTHAKSSTIPTRTGELLIPLLVVIALGSAQFSVASYMGFEECRGESKSFDTETSIYSDEEFSAKSFHPTETPEECENIEEMEQVIATEPRLPAIIFTYDTTPADFAFVWLQGWSNPTWKTYLDETDDCWREDADLAGVSLQYDDFEYKIEIDWMIGSMGKWVSSEKKILINPNQIKFYIRDKGFYFYPMLVQGLMHESIHGERDQNPNITKLPDPLDEHRFVHETAYDYFWDTYGVQPPLGFRTLEEHNNLKSERDEKQRELDRLRKKWFKSKKDKQDMVRLKKEIGDIERELNSAVENPDHDPAVHRIDSCRYRDEE